MPVLNLIRMDSNRRERKTNIYKINREKPAEVIRSFIERLLERNQRTR